MELRHLRYFVTLAKELHFGRAASALHISQPPLSIQIRDLEKEIGVKLFNRTKRSVSLTQAGSSFLEAATDILQRVTLAKTSARQAARGEIGNIVVGFISVADYNLLPRVIRQFQKNYPLVTLDLREATSDTQLEDLANGVIDVGFLLPPIKDQNIESMRITSERLIAVLPTNHIHAKVPGAISISQLSDSPFIMTPKKNAPGLHDGILRFCDAFGFQPKISQEAIQMQTIVSLVSAEMGVSLIPESIKNLRRPGVVYKTLKEKSPLVEIHMAWRNDNPLLPLQKFIDVALSASKSS